MPPFLYQSLTKEQGNTVVNPVAFIKASQKHMPASGSIRSEKFYHFKA